MYHKQIVDDHIKSAISEGLESQRAARARMARIRKPNPLLALIKSLLAGKNAGKHRRQIRIGERTSSEVM